ncbi:MAG: hypothetical protein KF708_20740 [Pirellulales bacterium]|nr:hypothetical protein [Pirellulales bacterium]
MSCSIYFPRILSCWPVYLSLALALLALATPPAVLAQGGASAPAAKSSDRPEFKAISVGIEHRYKTASWTPVEFTVAGGSEPFTVLLSVTVADGDGYPSEVTSTQPTVIVPGRETRLSINVKPGRVDGNFTARLVNVENGREVARHTFDTRYEQDAMHPMMALASDDLLMVMMGPGIGLESAMRLQGMADGPRTNAIATFRSANQLPSRWIGYDGVDLLVLSTSDATLFRPLATDSAQVTALDEWVKRGGNLLMFVGSQAPEILAVGAPLARFAPGEFVEMVPMPNLAPLEEYAEDTNSPIVPPHARNEVRRIQVPRLAHVEGDVEASAGSDLPLVVRRAYGLGQITFVAIDLDRAPFSNWGARDKFVSRLMGYPTRAPQSADDSLTMLSGQSYGDIAAALRSVLDAFEGVRIAPFWFVAMLVFGYIVLIGPVDYFLVRHVFKRMELTWITFPAMVLTISVGAYALAFWMKGDQLLVNQIDLLDVDVATGQMRGTSWWNVFSPTSSSYDVKIAPVLPNGETTDKAEELVSWMGAIGSSLGGAYSSAGDPPLWARPYAFAPQLDEMLGVPIQVWSTKSFTSQWNLTDEVGQQVIESSLRYENSDVLAGTIRSRLKMSLTDCVIAHDIWAYPIGKLVAAEEGRPGDEIDLSDLAQRRIRLERWLSQGDRTPAEPNATGLNVTLTPGVFEINAPELVLRMLFFKAAGGDAKLGMVNQYEHRLDLSRNLRPGFRRAILVGRVEPTGDAPAAAANLLLDGEVIRGPHDKHWVLYRFLLPVEDE